MPSHRSAGQLALCCHRYVIWTKLCATADKAAGASPGTVVTPWAPQALAEGDTVCMLCPGSGDTQCSRAGLGMGAEYSPQLGYVRAAQACSPDLHVPY